ncbi:MAG TPA: nickel pincer cofactor biosynthesis protein LarB [Nitrospiria bacterium]|nr:nickel pincer cofactor biosynthesis protein LarB [Nitrospiria bacterium]
MNATALKTLLGQVKDGELSIQDAMSRLRHLPYEPLEFANLDHHRLIRQDVGEAVYCEGKTPEQTRIIIERMRAAGNPVLATRAKPEHYHAVKQSVPTAQYHETARMITVTPQGMADLKNPSHQETESVLILTAGTSDVPVGEEARISLRFLGNRVETLFDVGVAGLHRLADNKDKIESATVLIVAAGMDGALPSVVGGWTDKPVIAVPTSQGYGSSFEGLSALLAMLNSCAPGVAVMNIDNGFGAAVLAHRILTLKQLPGK